MEIRTATIASLKHVRYIFWLLMIFEQTVKIQVSRCIQFEKNKQNKQF